MPRPALDTTKRAKVEQLRKRIQQVLMPIEFLKRNIKEEEIREIEDMLKAASETADRLIEKLAEPEPEPEHDYEQVIGSVIQFVMKDGDARKHLRELLDRSEAKEKSGRRK